MTAVRADVAELLRAGATVAEIKQRCRVSSRTITRTRDVLRIPVPADRGKRSRAELDAIEDQAVTMLRQGATVTAIRADTRLSLNRIAALRKQHQIPIPDRDRAAKRLTVDEVFDLHTEPTPTGGHLLWTGPRSGRRPELNAAGHTHNARAVAFRKHYGRDPEGRLRRTCDQPACIAGAHHTDHRIRRAHTRADQAYTAIFGPDA